MEEWAERGYPNHASFVMAERNRVRKEEQERMRKNKAKLMAEARAKLQPPGSFDRTITSVPKF